MEVVVPPEVADELIKEGLAKSTDNRGLLMPGGDEMAVVLTLYYAAGTAVTLLSSGPAVARALAEKLVFWRGNVAEPEPKYPYHFEAETPAGRLSLELRQDTDVEAIRRIFEAYFDSHYPPPGT